MGKRYWDEAEKAAGEAYGRANAAAYERREKFKRAAGWVLVGALGLYLAARTWGPGIWEASRTPLLYGVGALFVLAGAGGLVYANIRIRRMRRRTRTYETELYVGRTRPTTYVREDW